jgi:hypothetical protein
MAVVVGTRCYEKLKKDQPHPNCHELLAIKEHVKLILSLFITHGTIESTLHSPM